MKLTDQEQVIVKAIGSGVAEISRVIRAVGYPKASVKKVLARLNEKGIVALHRHDYPQSLKPEQRKLMLRLKDSQGRWAYYNAVSMRKQNPKGKHLRGATAKQERQYEHILESAKKYHRYGKRKKEVAARTVRARQNPKKSGKGKEALKTTGRALKSAARGLLGAGSQILGAGAKALNPIRRRTKKAKKKAGKRNAARAIHLTRKTKAGRARTSSKTSRKKTTPRVRSVVKTRKIATRRVALKKSSSVKGKRRNASKKTGEPIRIMPDQLAAYNAGFRDLLRIASQTGTANISPAPALMRQWGYEKYYRQGWSDAKIGESGKHRYRKNPKRNPSAESIRKTFAGSVNGERDLFFPQGTPQGLAKLGKLVSITTEEGTIKPISGAAWLCADTKERLHIGSTSPNPLFDGPKRSFGKVSKVEYEGAKPHLGYKGPIIWFHHLGEESGHKPTLHADGKGGLVFKGGQYRLTKRGIEN